MEVSAAGLTVSAAEPVTAPMLARMFAVPAAVVLVKPVELTVTVTLEEAQVANPDTSLVVPFV